MKKMLLKVLEFLRLVGMDSRQSLMLGFFVALGAQYVMGEVNSKHETAMNEIKEIHQAHKTFLNDFEKKYHYASKEITKAQVNNERVSTLLDIIKTDMRELKKDVKKIETRTNAMQSDMYYIQRNIKEIENGRSIEENS